MPVFNEINVPNEIFTKILMKLDGRSLHTARQVSKEWNSVIKEQIMGTAEGRREMERTLQHQWRELTPARLEFTIKGGAPNSQVLTISDPFAVICSKNSSSDMTKVRVVNIREGVEVMEVSCPKDSLVYDARLFKDVLVVAGGTDVLAWNIHTRKKIFEKKFSAQRIVSDHQNLQVMLGRSLRLEISGSTVIETIQSPLPGPLESFSHPYYLTGGSGGDPHTLWKVDGNIREEIGVVGVGMGFVFCPAREILVTLSVSVHSLSRIKLRVYSCLTGQLIKDRDVTAPTASYHFQNLQVNDNQLVVGCMNVMLVYQLESLLSQSADQDISPRMLEIGQPGFFVCGELDMSKTSVSAVLERIDEEKTIKFILILFDFWNCQD